jgi:triosephosphate isomerase
MPRKIAAGNWKMHGDTAALAEIDALLAIHPAPSVDIVICPPATLIHRMAERAGRGPIAIGGQCCHPAPSGAHTGDISAAMLVDAGASHVILGHSERRTDHAETDALIGTQLRAAQTAGLRVILCLGETAAERDAGRTRDVVCGQLAGSLPDQADPKTLILAYEPVWAIGTGRVPSPAQITDVHSALRAALIARFGPAGSHIPILYGGSVKPDNAAMIFALPDVDGALVGGASLKAAEFSRIITALAAA